MIRRRWRIRSYPYWQHAATDNFASVLASKPERKSAPEEKTDNKMTPQEVQFTIAAVRAEETYPLRAEILMTGHGEASALHGDLAPTTVHFAVSDRNRIVAVASLCEETSCRTSQPGEWRLRGMAVHPSARGLGFGRLLVNLCVRHVREQRGNLIWCTARESAYRFYELLGFTRDVSPTSIVGRDDLTFYMMRRRL